MIRFNSDYLEGAHPKILQKLTETNLEQTPGYGEDRYCEEARELIRRQCNASDAYVQFLVGGTQANLTVIASILKPYQGVLCAATGHINIHETGAIEATGHKVLAMPSEDGKITAAQVRAAYDAHWNDADHEHIVQPGMVYISHPTENGTLYTKEELTELSAVCVECGLPLFLDGARLGYGLMSSNTDVTLEDIAAYTDVFYIGGTKVGALFGEAVVITNKNLQKDFRYMIKQRGGMLAKGRLLGIQFLTLLEDGLYQEIAKKADEQAMRLKQAFLDRGFPLLYDSYTNQQYPIMPDQLLERLEKKYTFALWCKTDSGHSAVRFCTSWATRDEDIDALIADLDV
ncbi:MAG: threonine aldolase family protein [Lachnospiraceae bacterium]